MINVRDLHPDDWEVWRDLRIAALAEAPYAFHSRLEDWLGVGETAWRERLAAPGRYFVADLDDRPAGMACAIPPDPEGIADLLSLWVAPHGRGLGVGDALVSAVLAQAAAWAAERLALHVVIGNDAASGLYRRHGFADFGTIARPDGVVEIRMERPVPQDLPHHS